jgi:hypothetical protein
MGLDKSDYEVLEDEFRPSTDARTEITRIPVILTIAMIIFESNIRISESGDIEWIENLPILDNHELYGAFCFHSIEFEKYWTNGCPSASQVFMRLLCSL